MSIIRYEWWCQAAPVLPVKVYFFLGAIRNSIDEGKNLFLVNLKCMNPIFDPNVGCGNFKPHEIKQWYWFWESYSISSTQGPAFLGAQLQPQEWFPSPVLIPSNRQGKSQMLQPGTNLQGLRLKQSQVPGLCTARYHPAAGSGWEGKHCELFPCCWLKTGFSSAQSKELCSSGS